MESTTDCVAEKARRVARVKSGLRFWHGDTVISLLMFGSLLTNSISQSKTDKVDMIISRRSTSLGFALMSACCLASTPALAQTPLQRAMDAPTRGPVYSYDISYSTPKIKAAGRIDPTRPVGKRVTVTVLRNRPGQRNLKKPSRKRKKTGTRISGAARCSKVFRPMRA